MRINKGAGPSGPVSQSEIETMRDLADPYHNFSELKNRDISILFSVPTKDRTVSLDFCNSLVQTAVAVGSFGIPFVLANANNTNFTDLTRNRVATMFRGSKCTHLLQIDSDMRWDHKDILKMLLYDKEFIAGAGRKKMETVEFAGVPMLDDDMDVVGQMGKNQEDVLIKMKWIGGALTLQKRSVFDKLAKDNPGLRCNAIEGTGYAFYHCKYNLISHQTEDYVFCDLCTKSGIDIWCYPNMEIGHQGLKDYAGNYFEHSRKEDDPMDKIKNLMNGISQKELNHAIS